MKMTLTESYFLRAWADSSRADYFSRDALRALFEHIEELEQDMGEEMEFDIVGLCCDWTEYDTAREAASEYSWKAPEQDDDESPDDYAERVESDALEWLEGETRVVEFDGGVLVLAF